MNKRGFKKSKKNKKDEQRQKRVKEEKEEQIRIWGLDGADFTFSLEM